jgi:hypothetical protein
MAGGAIELQWIEPSRYCGGVGEDCSINSLGG